MNQLQAWNTFLAGGPARWARVSPPTINTQVRTVMSQALASPDPTSDPNVEYLMWRRSLNPRRFDYWHPHMGPRLQALSPEVIGPVTTPSPVPEPEQNVPPVSPPPSSSSSTPPPDTSTPSVPGTTTPPPDTSPPPSSGTTTPPEIVIPPTEPVPSPEPIPEPETLVMGVVLLGSGLWWRHRNRRAPGRP